MSDATASIMGSEYSLLRKLRMLTRYKAWADELTFSMVASLPEGEALKQRPTSFGNMVRTLNHVYVVDDIFKHHLQQRKHTYTARNTDHTPPLEELWSAARKMSQWYVALVDGWTDNDAARTIRFEFIGGGEGCMTAADIIFHIVNHGTYHRGFVGDMAYQIPVTPPSNDLPVYLRDHHREGD